MTAGSLPAQSLCLSRRKGGQPISVTGFLIVFPGTGEFVQSVPRNFQAWYGQIEILARPRRCRRPRQAGPEHRAEQHSHASSSGVSLWKNVSPKFFPSGVLKLLEKAFGIRRSKGDSSFCRQAGQLYTSWKDRIHGPNTETTLVQRDPKEPEDKGSGQ